MNKGLEKAGKKTPGAQANGFILDKRRDRKGDGCPMQGNVWVDMGI